MEASNLGYQTWAIALYQVTTNLKGVSSMKLHRDLGITQRSAWFLAHRLREAWKDHGPQFTGPVEADETYIGGKRKNMPKAKRKTLTGRGAVGKAIVVGAKDRETNRVTGADSREHGRPDAQGLCRGAHRAGRKGLYGRVQLLSGHGLRP